MRPRAPTAPRELQVHEAHGDRREDPYAWMRRKSDPRVRRHLAAENAHCREAARPWSALERTLREEHRALLIEEDQTTPYREGHYLYYARTLAGVAYPLYCRRRASMRAAEEIYFDTPREARGHRHFEVGSLEPSPDGRQLAVATACDGDEDFALEYRDLRTGKRSPGPRRGISPGGFWSRDGRYYFYVHEGDARRPSSIWRHRMGTPTRRDVCIYQESDTRFIVGLDHSQDGRLGFVICESKATTEVFWLPLDEPEAELRPTLGRRAGIRYDCDHHEGRLLIRTNDGAARYRLVSVPLDIPHNRRHWRVLVPGSRRYELEGFMVLQDHLVLFERGAGRDRIRVRDWQDEHERIIRPDDPLGILEEGVNPEYATEEIQLLTSSPTQPGLTYALNLRTGERRLLKREPVPDYRPEDYCAERIDVPGDDGVGVPLIIWRHRAVARDGRAPGLLMAYGAYGAVEAPVFSRHCVPLLRRGLVLAQAHPRGSGFLGDAWYEAGKLEHKPNTFADTEACAAALIAGGWVAPDRLALEGASAGGLLVGAVLNRRPELFRAAVAAVPFVDVLTSMSDPSLPLTTEEYEEWGNPADPAAYQVIRSYSPVDNVAARPYPALLVTAGLHDPRVPYWEPAKWVAQLRRVWRGPRPLLLRTRFTQGHGGASDRYRALRELAFEQAFILAQLNLPARPGKKSQTP